MSCIVLRATDVEAGELLARYRAPSPFATAQYARAMQNSRDEIWLIGYKRDDYTEVALGRLTKSRLQVRLEFPSLPAGAEDVEFWSAVDSFCIQTGVTDVVACTFGSPAFQLPPLRGEKSRDKRQETIVVLQDVDLTMQLSSNHKRNAKKAKAAGVFVRRTRDRVEWLSEHTRLMADSGQRRTKRGETVSMNLNLEEYCGYLQSGAGELFQAVKDERVLSSILILRSAHSAYYHSAGTSREGMNVGSSHFLVLSVMQTMQAEGMSYFNLGGAPEGSSLARFKHGFGGTNIDLEAAVSYLGPNWKLQLRTTLQTLRAESRELLAKFGGRAEVVPPAEEAHNASA